MNPWLLGATIYLTGGWLTLACCTYTCAKDPRAYYTNDFWCAFIISAIWPIAWPVATFVVIALIVRKLLKRRRAKT